MKLKELNTKVADDNKVIIELIDTAKHTCLNQTHHTNALSN